MTDGNTSPDILEQALEMIDDIEAADFDELLQSVADNVVGTEPVSDTLLSDIPRTTPPRVGRTTSRSQRVTRPLGSIRSGIRPGQFAARKSPRNLLPLSPQVRIVNPPNTTPSTGRSSRRGGNGTPASSTYGRYLEPLLVTLLPRLMTLPKHLLKFLLFRPRPAPVGDDLVGIGMVMVEAVTTETVMGVMTVTVGTI